MFQDYEARWQRQWELDQVYKADARPDAERFFGLIEFPFPSGDGLHVGHVRPFTGVDVVTRKQRMMGKNVLFPIGWDAFGLPTENYAIKNKVRPQDATAKNVANFTRQMRSLGLAFDWSREVNTTDPEYFKWTQWQFLQFVKQGMAHKAITEINWCPKCKIGLANEEAQGGVCERCGSPVEKREKSQWMISITDYAERLIKDLDKVDYLEKIKAQQKNWIGKSEGATIRFATEQGSVIEVFTTRPDTLFGVTYVVLAPEHALVDELTTPSQRAAVEAYRAEVARATDEQRLNEHRPKTGVWTGGYAINPANNERVPVWVADYVLATYGTGAVMAVPAHDERDFAFAKAFALPMKQVVHPNPIDHPIRAVHKTLVEGVSQIAVSLDTTLQDVADGLRPFTSDGEAINSDFINGAPTWKAKEEIIAWLEETGHGERKTTYRLRDWVFSRQRYWGEPIPLVKCEACATKKQKALIIHGMGFSPDSAWYGSARAALEQEGFSVAIPELPDACEPTYEGWMNVLRPFVASLGEDDVIIGHSLGGLMALHAIAETGVRVGRVFLVAPLVGEITDEAWDERIRTRRDRDWNKVRAIHERHIDWGKIQPLVGSGTVLVSDDDTRVPKAIRSSYPKGWMIKSLGAHGHFVSEVQPELVTEFARAKHTGWIPVPEAQLPLELPPIEAYTPSDDGESPLATMPEWFNTSCPRCGGPAKRETDTMPNWAGSSWYFLRYTDPHNNEAFASDEAMKRWLPINLYNGGMEHTTLHLLYSRFWYKLLFDMGYIPEECGDEPYAKRRSQGLILAQNGEKMSKSKGNVVNPDDVVKEVGSDVLRTYIMFMGPFDQPVPWDTNGIQGVKRFLDRVWSLYADAAEAAETPALKTVYHQTVKKLTEGIDGLQFNTCVSQLMILSNAYQEVGGIPEDQREGFVQLLAPFAPHLAEDIWHTLGKTGSIHTSGWPTYDPQALESDTYELVVQVNGKVRGKVRVDRSVDEETARAAALRDEAVQRWCEGKTIEKTVFIPGRLISFILSAE
jgi:leucyl-tRNA synthetase/predicted alpha/beta hydrolase family esterase